FSVYSHLKAAHAKWTEWAKARGTTPTPPAFAITEANVVTARAEATLVFVILKGHLTADLTFDNGQWSPDFRWDNCPSHRGRPSRHRCCCHRCISRYGTTRYLILKLHADEDPVLISPAALGSGGS